MNSVTQVQFRGTNEQVAAMTVNCERSEALFANTLLSMLDRTTEPENRFKAVLDFFRTVRYMSQANLISSGISVGLVQPDEVKARVLEYLRKEGTPDLNLIEIEALFRV